MAGEDENTYVVVTANGDWQELGEAGDGATVWELPGWAEAHLNDDPGSIRETLEEHGMAVVGIHTEPPGNLRILGDIDSFVEGS